jgi:hypothetical protein
MSCCNCAWISLNPVSESCQKASWFWFDPPSQCHSQVCC